MVPVLAACDHRTRTSESFGTSGELKGVGYYDGIEGTFYLPGAAHPASFTRN
jgi:hypothetical protein